MSTPAAVRTVDVGRATRQYLFLGALVPAALGIVGVLCGGFGVGLTGSGAGTRIAVGVIGGSFLLIAGAVFYLLAAHPPRRFLDIAPESLSLRSGKHGFTVPWSDVRDLSLVRTRPSVEKHTTVRGLAVLVDLPRWYLRVDVTGNGMQHVDLGPRRGVLREVQDALGARVRVDQSRPRPPST